MRRRHRVFASTLLRAGAVSALAVAVLVACAGPSALSTVDGTGPDPVLPAPIRTLLPTVHVADAQGWPAGAMPTPAAGLAVNAFATGLDHPRWLYVLPNGDVLVAETAAPPPPPDTAKGPRALVMAAMMKKAGSAVPSANRISLLRDADGDGVAESRSVLLAGLNSPFGMALANGQLYVANADAVVKVPYRTGDTRIAATPVKVVDLPGGPINHHWTKSLVASPDGKHLYAGVGSNSNVGEQGMEVEEGRAAIHEIDVATGRSRIYASGLRNPVGMAWEPSTGALWVAVNERDELGNDLVPDYMTAVREGAFYGWPYSYYGNHLDSRVSPQRPDLVSQARKPDYALGAATASLGLAVHHATPLPHFPVGAPGRQRGSWPPRPFSGYKVVFVPFANGQPSGPPQDVLTGFLDGDVARGRPVGVAVDKRGAILVADDVGNTVWRVAPAH